MDLYHIVQLTTSGYALFNDDFKRLDKDGNIIPLSGTRTKAVLTQGMIEIFIKKNKAVYVTYLKFSVPQLKRIIDSHAYKIPTSTK